MADKKLEIIISAIDKATAPFKKLGKTLNDFSESNKESFEKMAVGGAAAFGGIVFEMSRMVEAGKEAQRGAAQLEAVIKSTGGSAGLTAKEVSDMAGSLSQLNAISDDAILSGQNMLLTFTNIGKDVFPQVSQTMLDMATAMNNGITPSAEQLSNQAMQLGKALNDPINGISALTRVGVTFTEQQKEQIKTLQENGDMMGAQKVILTELGKEFGGSALAQAQTYEGQMRKLSLALGESEEAIGLALIPTLNSLMETIKPIIETTTTWIQKNPELAKNILIATASIAGLVVVLGTLGLAIPLIVTGFTSVIAVTRLLGTALMFLAANPVGIIITAIGVLAFALYKVWENWSTIYPIIVALWESIKTSISGIVGAISAYITETFNYIVGFVSEKIDWLAKKAQQAKQFLSDILASTAKAGANFTIQGALGLNADFSKKTEGARALGGPVSANRSYLVGENGPEIFTPGASGKINNNPSGSSQNITINLGGVTVNGEADENRLVEKIKRALIRETQLYSNGIA